MMPKVSVLIPTYNHARFLAEAIESVQAQEFRDFELIIVDDGSSDKTAEMAMVFSGRDPRISVSVNTSNLGMVKNWNHCLTLAEGEYIKFIFGDDKLMDRRALGQLVAMLDQNPAATLAATARIVVDASSKEVDLWTTFSNGVHSGKDIITACLLQNRNLIGEPSAMLFRRTDARRGFDESYCQMVDLEMWFHLLERGDLVYTSDELCAFRRHPSQQTVVNNAPSAVAGQFNEQLRLVQTYGANPWMTKRQRLDILYRARRGLKKDPTAATQFFEMERQSVGAKGASRYFFPWLKYSLARPLENWRRARQKRKFLQRKR